MSERHKSTHGPATFEPCFGSPEDDIKNGGNSAVVECDTTKNSPAGVTVTHQGKMEALSSWFGNPVIRNSFFLWIVGFINNFHYCLIITAASSLAEGYGLKKLVALITWANIFFGVFARLVNMFIATRISYNVRITLMSVASILGILLVSFATPLGHNSNALSFVVMLIGVVLLGTASSYGESVVLTFLQRYPNSLVGAWSSGTGISGVAASLFLLGLRAAKLSNEAIFLISLPFCVIYWLSFTVGMVSPQKVLVATLANGKTKDVVLHFLEGDEEAKVSMQREKTLARVDVVSVSNSYETKMVMNLFGLPWKRTPLTRQPKWNTGSNEENNEDASYSCSPFDFLLGDLRRWWLENRADVKLMHSAMLWFFLNLAVVYVAEYAAQLMAPFSFYCQKDWKESFWVTNYYEITQFCYQIGVLLSRSSLLIIKIPYVGVISIIQIMNAICWILQAKLLYVKSENRSQQFALSFVLYGWMVFIGLLGGASYVNVFYLILKKSTEMQKAEEDHMSRYLEDKFQAVGEVEKNGSPLQVDMSTRDKYSEPALPAWAHRSGDSEENPGHNTETSLYHHEKPGVTEQMEHEINAFRQQINEVWTTRREIGMNIGALYASVGITVGTLIDLIFTNTMLQHDHRC